MRKAHSDTGWFSFNVTDPEVERFPPLEEVSGLSLGFDFCAEHEWGLPYLKEQFGIGVGLETVGLQARTITRVPESLGFFKFSNTEKLGSQQKKVPYAVLHCNKIWSPTFAELAPAKKMEFLELGFYSKVLALKPDRPSVHDFMSVVWDGENGFAVAVRGTEHVAKLEELHTAFLEKDVVISFPDSLGFLRRGPALIQLSKVPTAVADKCLKDDVAHAQLLLAAGATGIEKRLKAAKLGWYALSPAWDGSTTEPSVHFYLNPHQQDKYAGGWFTVKELDAWIEGTGPVMDGLSVKAYLGKIYNDFDWHLSRGLEAHGASQKRHLKYVWLDAPKTKPGIILTIHNPGETSFKSGTYSLEELLPFYEEGIRKETLKKEQSKVTA